jgi:hypothetical protein
MPIILRKHRFTNICNLCVICIITFHVPHPYNSTDLTLILNIRTLVFISIVLFFHNVCSSTKIPFYPLIRALTYWSAPTSAVTALPRHVSCSTLTSNDKIHIFYFEYVQMSLLTLLITEAPALPNTAWY